MVRPQDGREGGHIVIRMLGVEMPGKRKEMLNILHVGLRRKGAFFVRNEHWGSETGRRINTAACMRKGYSCRGVPGDRTRANNNIFSKFI